MATDVERRARVTAIFAETVRVHEEVRRMDSKPIVAAADRIARALRGGGKLLTFGNGGSAADAQHVAAELVGRFAGERPALAALALTSDVSILTSVANDYEFGHVFARQIEALGRPGDVALGISTSGGSANVINGVVTARRLGLTTVALTGRDGGALGAAADVHINVPSESRPRVQEVHITILHAICELIEGELSGPQNVKRRTQKNRSTRRKTRSAETHEARSQRRLNPNS